MFRVSFACFSVALLAALILSGCGGSTPDPTPTPTKTPVAAVVQAEAPTATPTVASVPPTAVPTVAANPPTATPRPENIAPYTGLPVADPAVLRRQPLLICVNNDAVGRSAHHGLSLADVIYEYIVDGFTLTRLTGVYQSRESEHIGPVRSARLPNIWMTYMYDGALACSGGSDEVRYLLKNEVDFPYLDADLDDPSNNRYFFTVGTDYRTRMQASTEGVRRWLSDQGQLVADWNRPGFQFSEQPSANSAGQANVVQIAYPGGNQVEWRYDPNLGGYVRFQGGQQQFDQLNNQPIVAQNVIAITAPHELTDIVEDTLGTRSVDIQLYGFGDFRIFRDGLVYEGTWRADPENPPRWLGPGEAIIPLRPGQSWVQVARDLSEISYQ